MADQRTMAKLLQAPAEGYRDAIVILAILGENFELKHGLLNLVTSKEFCGFEKEDPHAHIHWFNKITSMIKYKDVPNASIKLMLFPFSIKGAARIWLKKISFVHAHITVSHQIDTFYNFLTLTDQDLFNATVGGNLLTKTPKDALILIENKSKVYTSRNRPVVSKVSTNTSTSGLSPDVAALTDAVKALLLKNTTPPPASVKAVEENNIQAYVSAAVVNYNQGNAGHRPSSVAHQEVGLFWYLVAPDPLSPQFLVPPPWEEERKEEESKGDIRLIKEILNNDTYSLLPLKDLKCEELKSVKSSVDEPSELELKDLPSHLEYAFLEGTNKLPVIIAKNLKDEEKERLIKVLKSHKQAIAWKLSDIKGIDLKLNDAIRKDHFPLPFMHQMLERLARNEYYCFLDGFSRYFQIPIDLQDQEKTTFTCPYGMFAYRQGIVLGHKISKSEIKVDRAKFDVIAILTPRTSVKGIRSFLGHNGFYRQFIQDFSKIAQPVAHLLEKETLFLFSTECREAFKSFKEKLTESLILVAPDWDLPFEIMCDASNFAVGAVLGQRKTKHFQPIHYESKTITNAQAHYTITEKELLAVVYAFEKFRPYLVLSKTIVYTDQSALMYQLAKQDAKPRLLYWILLL
nr:DNA-directed DNA polymerase [Tanacetum cinerariifolium]